MTRRCGAPACSRTHRSTGLGGLIGALGDLGLLRGARSGGRAIGAAALSSLKIAGIAYDSRSVRPGTLFVAIPGEHADGHDFVEAAADAGATASIVERALPDVIVPQLVVESARATLGHAASWFYGRPSHELAVVGVTGTDGKSTTCALIVAAFEAAGRSAGLVGTVEMKIDGTRDANPEHVTTPQAPELPGSPASHDPGRRRRRDPRDDIARARARAGRRNCLRRGRLHEPEPRASASSTGRSNGTGPRS